MIRSEPIPYEGRIRAAPVSAPGFGILLIQFGILFATIILVIEPSSFIGNERDAVYPCCVLILLHACWAIWSWRWLAGTLVDPYVFFFLSVFLFNGGQALLEVFGLNPAGLLDGEFDAALLERALLLVLCGLAAVHAGALIAMYQSRGKEEGQTSPPESPSQELALRVIGWLVLAVSVGPLMILFRDSLLTVLSGGYQALYQKDVGRAGVGSALEILSAFVVPGSFLLLAAGKGRKVEVVVAILVLSIHAAIVLFLGFRGGAIMPLVPAAWVWERRVARLPRTLLAVIAAVLLIVVFPLVRETRMAPGKERTSTSYLVNAYSEVQNPLASMVSELGKSMITIAYTLELVPRERGYELGAGYAYGLLTVMPSLFWERHPVVVHGLAGAWLIQTIDPYVAEHGGGIGFSFIAEAFLNFGVLGVPFVALLTGYLVVQFFLWGERGGAARLAIVAAFVPTLLFYARGEFADLPRALVWYSLAPYAACLLLERMLRTRTLLLQGQGWV
jgi:oligosaccharide repeat unit polymerase